MTTFKDRANCESRAQSENELREDTKSWPDMMMSQDTGRNGPDDRCPYKDKI